jgi:hypothetical protein
MVDSGIMTEPREPAAVTADTATPLIAGAGLLGVSVAEGAHVINDKHASIGSQTTVATTDAASQWLDPRFSSISQIVSQGDLRHLSTSTYSDRSSQYDPAIMDEKLAKFPTPPIYEEHMAMAGLPSLGAAPPPLSMSTIVSEHVEPTEPEINTIPEPLPVLAPLALSTIQSTT